MYIQNVYCNHTWYSNKIPHPIRCPSCKRFLCDNIAKKDAKRIFGDKYHRKYMYIWIKRDIIGDEKRK